LAKFWADKDMDFSYIAKDNIPYRVNALMKLGKIGVVMRKINAEAKQLEEFMYEDVATTIKNKVLKRKTGLFLVT
jgi:Tfp pilus assembly pilus retraction ATPase PilT